jgi:hypothetical protein
MSQKRPSRALMPVATAVSATDTKPAADTRHIRPRRAYTAESSDGGPLRPVPEQDPAAGEVVLT